MADPTPCGAVFRVGSNAPATCALRFNHLGPHRDWRQVADDREALLNALEYVRGLAHDEDQAAQRGDVRFARFEEAVADAIVIALAADSRHGKPSADRRDRKCLDRSGAGRRLALAAVEGK